MRRLHELRERQSALILRDDEEDGAPPHRTTVAVVRMPQRESQRRRPDRTGRTSAGVAGSPVRGGAGPGAADAPCGPRSVPPRAPRPAPPRGRRA
ncbi:MULTISPECIES: DUF6191 domain-containing protein [Streptomyces]|uniref:DUF6191 domain-containing protein n=2 Tax=Streptomyces TaxID=1883 RepID=A0ABV9J031_9ACTN